MFGPVLALQTQLVALHPQRDVNACVQLVSPSYPVRTSLWDGTAHNGQVFPAQLTAQDSLTVVPENRLLRF